MAGTGRRLPYWWRRPMPWSRRSISPARRRRGLMLVSGPPAANWSFGIEAGGDHRRVRAPCRRLRSRSQHERRRWGCSILDVSRTLAVVLAGGEGERLSILSGVRAKPAVPFGGKYRIIDFTLSNCVNSGLTNVIVLTQYAPLSLNDHIGAGRPWDLDRNIGGIRILQPFVARGRAREWYRGTADAVATNLDAIQQSGADIVLILAGDHIYKMDYGPFIQQHRRKRADVTIAVKPVPLAEAHRFGVLTLDDNDAVTEWQEKPRQPRSDLASLGIYVFSRKALDMWLGEGRHDFGKDIIPAMLDAGARVYGYRFEGYWQDVGTVHSYWEAQMELARRSSAAGPVRPRLGGAHPFGGAPAGTHRSDRQRPSQPHQSRLRHRRDGRALRALARRACRSRGHRA